MKEYTVFVRRTAVHKAEVWASSQEEALEKAREGNWMYLADAFSERVKSYKTEKEAFKPSKKDVARIG